MTVQETRVWAGTVTAKEGGKERGDGDKGGVGGGHGGNGGR